MFRVVDRPRSGRSTQFVVPLDGGADTDWYLQANHDLLAHAAELAADDLIVALTVRPPAGEIPHSATDDFADRAGRAGLIVLTVDPRPDSISPRS